MLSGLKCYFCCGVIKIMITGDSKTPIKDMQLRQITHKANF